MKGKRIFVGVCLVGLVLLIGLGVVYKVYAEDVQGIVSPKDFGQGVYYFSIITESRGIFDNTRRDPESFGRNLAAFKASHPNLRVTGIASRNNSGMENFELTVGYWVNFEEK